jgi:citrate synthase
MTRPHADYMSARDALAALGIRTQTLYAYVSRGWIRSLKQPGTKERLYVRDDVERMLARQRARSGHGAVAAAAMNLGDPIIQTSITEISPEGPLYRGRPAIELARRGVAFESVAELLWTGRDPDDDVRWPVAPIPAEVARLVKNLPTKRPQEQLLEVFAMAVLALGMARGTINERVRFGNPTAAARQIMQVLTGCLGFVSAKHAFVPPRQSDPRDAGDPGERIVDHLARALGVPGTDENLAALNAILITLADHELAPATFVARVAASGGSTLHSCLVAALNAHAGMEIGRAHDRIDELLAAGRGRKLVERVGEFQDKGLRPPGFGHPVYPRGDPRARYLIDLVRQRRRNGRRVSTMLECVDAVREKYGIHPRQDLAITIVVTALGLPSGAAGPAFGLARVAGWVAHVLEQRGTGTMLRPRARYVAG